MASSYKYKKFKIGTDLYCIVTFDYYNSYNNNWANPYIEVVNDIYGTSDMYSDSTNFILIEHSDDKNIWVRYPYEYTDKWREVGTSWSYGPGINLPRKLDLRNYNINTIANYMFSGWQLPEIYLPNSVSYINKEAFYLACGYRGFSASTLKLPSSLLYLGDRAFAGCENITTIDFSDCSITLSDITSSTNVFMAYVQQGTYIDTTIILGDPSIENDAYWQSQNRRNIPPVITTYKYVCHDSVNGDQQFPLLETPPSSQPYKVYSIYENGAQKNLYLPLVPMSDTTNGGNRVQFIPNLGSFRFKR